MANSRVLEYILKLRDEASREARKVANNISGSMDRATTASNILAGALGAATTSAIAFIGYGSKIAGDMEAAEQGFKALLGSAQAAQDTMTRIKREAKATPFELPGLVKGTQALAAITKDGDKAIDVLMDVGKAVAVSGKGAEELDRVILNLQQIASTGKVTAMDIRQFQGAIPIFNDIVEASGMTVDELKNSTTAAQDLFKAFEQAGQEGGITAEGFTGQAGTFNQLVGNMKDNIQILAMEVAKSSGAFDLLKEAIGTINNVLENIPIEKILSTLKEYLPVIAGAIVGGLIPALRNLGIKLLPKVIKVFMSFVHLIPWVALGAAIGLLAKVIIENWDEIKKAAEPFIQKLQYAKERFKQIMAEFGISGEFGSIINTFNQIREKVVWYADRIYFEVKERIDKLMSFIAFGNFEHAGETSIIQVLEGIWNRLEPLRQALIPILEEMKANFKLVSEIIKTQIEPAFRDLMVVMKPLIKAILPHLKTVVVAVFTIIAGIIALAMAAFTGFISGLSNAAAYVAQAIEGIIQMIRGFIQIVTGILNRDWGLVMEGFKQLLKGAWDFVVNAFKAILKFVKGFIDGVIAFFKGLYDTLIGHSIIPDIVNGIKTWFEKIPGFIRSALKGLASIITKPFRQAWENIKKIAEKIKNKMKEALDPSVRHSPSLIDRVKSGVREIEDQYRSLARMNIPSLPSRIAPAVIPSGSGGGTNNYTTQAPITINAEINNDMDAQQLAGIIGMELELRSRF